jgi:hypothetical protein
MDFACYDGRPLGYVPSSLGDAVVYENEGNYHAHPCDHLSDLGCGDDRTELGVRANGLTEVLEIWRNDVCEVAGSGCRGASLFHHWTFLGEGESESERGNAFAFERWEEMGNHLWKGLWKENGGVCEGRASGWSGDAAVEEEESEIESGEPEVNYIFGVCVKDVCREVCENADGEEMAVASESCVHRTGTQTGSGGVAAVGNAKKIDDPGADECISGLKRWTTRYTYTTTTTTTSTPATVSASAAGLEATTAAAATATSTPTTTFASFIVTDFIKSSPAISFPKGALVCIPCLAHLFLLFLHKGLWDASGWILCLEQQAPKCCHEGRGRRREETGQVNLHLFGIRGLYAFDE